MRLRFAMCLALLLAAAVSVQAAQRGPGEDAAAGYPQFSAELFHHLSGIKMLVVVYKGGGPALTDLMGGQVHINMGTLVQAMPHLKSGRVKPLATSGARRSIATPELPTLAEAGIAGYEANNWWAIGAPAGTPPAVVARLGDEIKRYLSLPETRKCLIGSV